MEIEKCDRKLKCDFVGCDNFAKYSLSTKKFLKRELVFCEDCLKGIYEAASKMFVPKGVKSPFKINERIKKHGREE